MAIKRDDDGETQGGMSVVAVTDSFDTGTKNLRAAERTLLDEKLQSVDLVVWSGDSELRPIILEHLGVSAGKLLDLGPSASDVEPIRVVAGCIVGCYWPTAPVRVAAGDIDGWVDSHDRTNHGQALNRLITSVQALQMSAGLIEQEAIVRLNEIRNALLESTTPTVWEGSFKKISEYLEAVIGVSETVFMDAGKHDWDRAKSRRTAVVKDELRAGQIVEKARASSRRLGATLGCDQEKVAGMCLKALERGADYGGDHKGKRSVQEEYLRELMERSALWFVKGDALASRGMNSVAFLCYWRSFDSYVYVVAFENKIVDVDERGRYVFVSPGGVGGEATIAGTLRELGNRGIILAPPESPQGARLMREAREIRNAHWLIHGIAQPDREVADRLRGLVRDSIVAYDRGKGSSWKAKTKELSRIDVPKVWLEGLARTVVDEKAVTEALNRCVG